MNWKGVGSNARCDKTRQTSFYFPNERTESCARRRRRRRGGEKVRGVGECLTLFKGNINSLSAPVLYRIIPVA